MYDVVIFIWKFQLASKLSVAQATRSLRVCPSLGLLGGASWTAGTFRPFIPIYSGFGMFDPLYDVHRTFFGVSEEDE